jgi:hypothetical protein
MVKRAVRAGIDLDGEQFISYEYGIFVMLLKVSH